ncbi:MAG: biotin/lipoyl-binding protein [Lachnospiraceae bacterium]|nr:biotin/lipoyl-binding protein [Lachnospiraceae bacterium]
MDNFCNGTVLRFIRFFFTALAVSAGMLLYTGCSLYPEEEERYKIRLERSETEVAYELVEVTRGDVLLTKRLFAQYQEENGEELAFGLDGRAVEALYVDKGDVVKKGDLLAKLECEDLEDEKAELEYTIKKNRLLKQQAEALLQFDIDRLDEILERYEMSRGDYDTRVGELTKNTGEAIEDYDDAMEIAQIRLSEVKKKLEGCCLYAGMDGTISYVSVTLTSGNNNYVAGNTVIRIVDTSHCLFVMEGEEWKEYPDFFKEGAAVTLTNNAGEIYETTVQAPDEETGELSLELNELDDRLTTGTRLFCIITVDESRDTLKLPPAAIHQAVDGYYVYVSDEGGLKSLRYVDVGLVGDDAVEIKSGLEEGDIVIRR